MDVSKLALAPVVEVWTGRSVGERSRGVPEFYFTDKRYHGSIVIPGLCVRLESYQMQKYV